MNRFAFEQFDYQPEELMGRQIFDMYDPDCRNDVKNAFQSFAKTGKVHDVKLQLLRKNRTTVDISLNVSAVRDADGKVLYSRACWTDITDRKKKELETKIAEIERMNLIFVHPELRMVELEEKVSHSTGTSPGCKS